MAIFKDTTVTDNGRSLIANALGNNKQITFTRMVTSSKVYSDTTDVSKLINIDEIKQTVNLSRVSQEGTKVRLNAIFTNASVNSAYKIETLGLYGKIDSGNEILYSVTRASEADTMPATNGINLATVEIDLITEINNSNGATMVINPSTLVTLSTLQDYIKHEEKMNWMGTDGYGGLLQDAGTKKVGIAYYDKVNKQMVVPTVENNLTYFEGSKFIPISDYQNAKKLENLSSFKSEKVTLNSTNGIKNQSFNLTISGNLRIIDFGNLAVKNEYQTKFILPDWFSKNIKSVNGSCANGTGGAGGEVAEIYLEAADKSLSFYPAHRPNFNGNLQLSGQIISFATD